MQIEAIVLYHRDLRRQRKLELGPGLNVVTGWRNTGKSSLLEIVEYCFGKEELEVAHGMIRDQVAWYGLVIRHKGRFAFAGRPKPRNQAVSTGDAMWLPLTDAIPPEASELAANTTADDLRKQLSSFGDFAEYRFDPPEDAFRRPLQLHVAHVLPACLQDEEDIDSKKHLFHRDGEREVKQALKDALPYWLGAADEKVPGLRFRLSQVKREIAHGRRDLERIRAAKSEADSRGLALLGQAADVGLVETYNEEAVPSGSDLAMRLEKAVAAIGDMSARVAPTGQVEQYLTRRRELHERLGQAERDEDLLRHFGSDRQDFTRETNEQRARLASIGLLRHEGDAAVCPVCASSLQEADPSTEVLVHQLEQLDDELQAVVDLEPRDEKALQDAMAVTARIKKELQAVHVALRDIASQDQEAATARDLASRQSFVQGLITEYLRTLAVDDPEAEQRLEDRLNQLDVEEKELGDKVDAEGEQERLTGALNVVGAQTTDFARRLTLEHADEGRVRVDLGKMTLMIDKQRDSFPLKGVGGAGTRVGYHLAAHFALHKLLRERDRPGPAFLLLDQPTGPFYPEDTPAGVEPQLKSEDDRAIVAELFNFIREFAQDLGDDFQVLVLDHFAAFDEEWFNRAMVGNWREGRGLLPADWVPDGDVEEI